MAQSKEIKQNETDIKILEGFIARFIIFEAANNPETSDVAIRMAKYFRTGSTLSDTERDAFESLMIGVVAIPIQKKKEDEWDNVVEFADND